MYYQDALNKAKVRDSQLRAYDFVMGQRVFMCHDDGTQLDFMNAFYEKLGDGYICIYTEHHGYHVYDLGDIEEIYEYSDNDIDEEENETT